MHGVSRGMAFKTGLSGTKGKDTIDHSTIDRLRAKLAARTERSSSVLSQMSERSELFVTVVIAPHSGLFSLLSDLHDDALCTYAYYTHFK